jgi:hypothetical protein
MLAALLLAGIVAAPLGSAGLFAGARQHAHVAGAWPATRRLVLALLGTAVLAAAAGGVLLLLHATEHNLIAGAAGVVVASLIWLPVTRRWRARAHLCWSSSVFLFVVYLVFALRWTFESHVTGQPPEQRTALGLPGRRRAVVRRLARPPLPGLPAGRGVEPGYRGR